MQRIPDAFDERIGLINFFASLPKHGHLLECAGDTRSVTTTHLRQWNGTTKQTPPFIQGKQCSMKGRWGVQGSASDPGGVQRIHAVQAVPGLHHPEAAPLRVVAEHGRRPGEVPRVAVVRCVVVVAGR